MEWKNVLLKWQGYESGCVWLMLYFVFSRGMIPVGATRMVTLRKERPGDNMMG